MKTGSGQPVVAFLFWPSDFMVGTMFMSASARGIYIYLLCHQWEKGGLPDDPAELAELATVELSEFQAAWGRWLHRKFTQGQDGLLRNDKLEAVRQEQIEYRRQQSGRGKQGASDSEQMADRGRAGAAARWQPDGSTAAIHGSQMAAHGSPPSPSPSPSPELQKTTTKAFVKFEKPNLTREPKTVLDTLRQTATHAHVEAHASKAAAREKLMRFGATVVFTYWATLFDHPTARMDDKRERRIRSRLVENNGNVSEVLYALDGALKDDWIMGRDQQSTKKYDGLDTILRDRAQVERFTAGARWTPGVDHPYIARMNAERVATVEPDAQGQPPAVAGAPPRNDPAEPDPGDGA